MERLVAALASASPVLEVKDFVPDSGELTTSNFETALIAALDFAYAVTVTEAQQVGVTIEIPSGDWPMTQTLHIKGRYNYSFAPKLRGQGSHSTRFVYAALPTGGTYSGAGVCIWLDGSHAVNYPYTGGGLEGIGIRYSASHGATAVYGEHLLHTSIKDVDVSCTGAGYSSVSGQTGATASCSVADSYGLQTWTGLTGITKDCVLRSLTTTGAATGANNGTFTIVAYVSATSCKVFNASGTSDANNTALSWTEKYAATGFKFRGNYTNTRGVTVTNNQDVLTESLHCYGARIGGFFEACAQFVNTNLKLENCGRNVVLGETLEPFTVNGGLMQGISSHTFWELPSTPGGRHITLRDCYQEGAVDNILKTYTPTSGVNDYTLENVHQGNSTTYIDASGTRSIIVRMPGSQPVPTVWAKLRNVEQASFEGGVFESPATAPTLWDLDLASRIGFSVRGDNKPYHGSCGVEKGLNKFLVGRGDLMAEIWDARAVRKRTVNAGNLEALVGIVNGITLGPVNAAIYPTWTASNAAFNGAPTWNQLPGAAAAAGALTATMTVGALPVGSQPGLLCVFRNPSAADASNHYQRFVWTDGTNTTLIGMSDSVAVGAPGTDDSFYFYNQIVGQVLGPLSSTDTQAIYGGVCPAAGGTISGECNTADFLTTPYANMAAYASVAAGTVTVFGPAAQPIDNAIEVAWCGVTKRGMTRGELEQFLDLAAAEFGPIARY
jgi:hypothetical protein